MPKEIYVNAIHEENGLTRGMAVHNSTVLKNLEIIYDKEHREKMFILSKRNVGGINFFDNFCQYVIFVQLRFEPNDIGSISFLNCYNNFEIALLEFESYVANGWELGSIEDFKKKFEKVNTHIDDLALMVIEMEVS